MLLMSPRSRSVQPPPFHLFLLASLFFVGPAHASTYYVRTDGGNAFQCNGLVDAPYSGSSNQCAWISPHNALPTNAPARIQGGDTLIIGPGNYKIGLGNPDTDGANCYTDAAYNCYLAPVPSGTALAPTRILGKGYDAGCAAPPKLWGTERVYQVLNLQGSSHVEVGCLEITDQSDCVESHSASSVACQRATAPFGPWASTGVSASDSEDVFLHDLNIHGLAHTGIHAGRLRDWTVERVKINANGWVGWDGDIGANSANTGNMIFRNVEIAWNGCGQKWQTGEMWGCWAQQAGGYGDGLGTNTTGGAWLFEDSFVHHNTSDGIDLLYLDGASSTSATVRRTYVEGNAGNQIKTRGQTLLENNIVVGNCGYFQGRDYMMYGDYCRAQGNALSVGMVNNQSSIVRHNTVIGEGDCLLLTSGADSSSMLSLQNNAFIGQADLLATQGGNPELACFHYADNYTAQILYSGNLVYNVKQSQCPSGSICGIDPRVVSMSINSFNAQPQASSPLIDAAPALAAVASDFYLAPRPAGNTSDIGAIEVQSQSPPPTCIHSAPTWSLSGSTAPVSPGTALVYTVELTNNDSAACGSTTFNLASSVPAQWSSIFNVSALSVAPGAKATAGLSVSSPSSASEGSYAVGAGISSAQGQLHTASASILYTIQSTPPAPSPFADTITTDKPTYQRGQTVYLSSRVTQNGQPVANATVKFIVDRPDGVRTIKSATTDAQGVARTTFKLGTATAWKGTYWARADAYAGPEYAQALMSFNAL